MSLSEQVQRGVQKWSEGLDHLSYAEKVRQLWLFSLEKRRVQGHLVAAFQYIKGAYRKDRERLFTRTCSGRIRRNSFKMERG